VSKSDLKHLRGWEVTVVIPQESALFDGAVVLPMAQSPHVKKDLKEIRIEPEEYALFN
jgi:hypothetical protein